MSDSGEGGGGQKSKLRYTHSRDDVYALAIPDFSLAFHKSQLGNTLCFDNPKEERFLVSALSKIQKQEKNVVGSWFHHQREFFIKQVFDKDLNPYQAFTRSKSMAEFGPKTKRKKASQDAREKPSAEKMSQLPLIKNGDLDKSNHQQRSSDDINVQYRLKESRSSSEFKDGQFERLPLLGKSPGSGKGIAFVTHPAIVSDKFPPISKTITVKMNGASSTNVHGACADSVDHDKKENALLACKPMTSSLPNISKAFTSQDGTTVRKKVKKKTETSDSADLKLINKLSQTLPVHLFRKAEEKIRVITNTEAIYRNKKRLLEQHQAMLHNNALADPRWKKLESSLSENKETCESTTSGNLWEKSLPVIRHSHNNYF